MKPKRSAKATPQGDLFRARLDQILDHGHPLYRLADQIHWALVPEGNPDTRLPQGETP